MLDLDPLADDVMRLFRKERFEPCSPKKPVRDIAWINRVELG